MITETLLPDLGQGLPRVSRQVRPFSPHQPESGDPAVKKARKNPLTILDEVKKDHKVQSSMPISAVKISPYTAEPSESPLDEFQWRLHPQHRLRDEAKSTTTPPYYGRITGPVQFVNKLLATWDLEQESACALLGFEPSLFDYVNNVLQGYETLTGRDAKDRIVHLIQIRTSLSALFRNEVVENEWLREPHDTLNGKKPMDLLLEGSMENLLLVKEYVELVART